MSQITKPMLAVKATSLENIRYPVLASPKLDGIRGLPIPDGKRGVSMVSRNWKPIPNNFVRTWLEMNVPAGLDGEEKCERVA